MAQIIDGKAVSASVKQEVAEEAARLKEEMGLKKKLARLLDSIRMIMRLTKTQLRNSFSILSMFSTVTTR